MAPGPIAPGTRRSEHMPKDVREEKHMPVINHQTIPEVLMRPGIRGQFLAHKNLGAAGVSLLVNTVEPGAAAPLHKHTVEETMLVLAGTVWVRVGEEYATVGPNYTVIIPAGTPHAWGNN